MSQFLLFMSITFCSYLSIYLSFYDLNRIDVGSIYFPQKTNEQTNKQAKKHQFQYLFPCLCT